MIAYFLERIPSDPDFKMGIDRVALTAEACYELESAGLSYEIPEDYARPERLTEQSFKGVVNSASWDQVFIEILLQNFEASIFWERFIDIYLFRHPDIQEIFYYGNDIKRLVWALNNYAGIMAYREKIVEGIREINFTISR